jgi:hypothetical protein
MHLPAFWMAKIDMHGLGLDFAINIYERNNYIGGSKLLNSSKYFLGSAPSPSDSILA